MSTTWLGVTSLGIGEAVVTRVIRAGAPTPVAWTRLRSPRSLMAAIGNDAIAAAAKASPLQGTYGETKDRNRRTRRSKPSGAEGPN